MIIIPKTVFQFIMIPIKLPVTIFTELQKTIVKLLYGITEDPELP